MTYPSQWRTFCKWHRANRNPALPVRFNFSKLGRFAARYRLVSNFQGLNLEGYAGASTIEGYSSVMRAFLAYSALEQLHEATKEKSTPHHLNNRWAASAEKYSAQLRQTKKILLFLQKQMDSSKLRDHLQEFTDGKTDNSLYVATALRHAVAHGLMSAHPKGISPKTVSHFCDRISEMLIAIADAEFTALVESIAQIPEP